MGHVTCSGSQPGMQWAVLNVDYPLSRIMCDNVMTTGYVGVRFEEATVEQLWEVLGLEACMVQRCILRAGVCH